MIDDDRLRPYRVEWRRSLHTRWLCIRDCDTREEADRVLWDTKGQHRGYVRLISQHVIETNDLTQGDGP